MYKVYEADEKVSKKGNKYKKLVLQKEGDQYPKKNVTMFESHPEFAQTIPGYELNCELNEKDSGTPNPHAPGKNYIDRTVANPGESGTNDAQQVQQLDSGKLDRMFYMVEQIFKQVVPAIEKPEAVKTAEELEPDAIPF